MSSLARRTLRIIAAAAGTAVLGAALAGNAFAAPAGTTSTSEPSTVRGHTQTYSAQTSSTQDPDDALVQTDTDRLVDDVVEHPVVSPQSIGGSTLGLPLG